MRYKKIKNKLIKHLKFQKNKYYNELFSKNNQSDNWKIINKLINKKYNNFPNIFIYNGIEIHNEKDQYEYFNNYFSNIGENIVNTIHNSNNDLKLLIYNQYSFYFIPINNSEIINVTNSMKSKVSMDVNNYYMSLIKQIINCILYPINHIFNNSIVTGLFPTDMKKSIIKPLFKNNDNKNIINYRPIALLPQISKIFEKIIYNRLSNFIIKHKIINKNQYGFIPKSNTTISLLNIQHYILQKNSEHKKIATIFLNLKKAFDVVDHVLLLKKLEIYGIRGNIYNLIKSYLNNRTFTTKINNSLSNTKYVKYGVPQGSVLGPLFFIIFINDLQNVFINVNNINLNLYADDTSLTVYANSDVELTKLLQIYMDKLKYWFDINNLKLNIQKTKILPYFNTKLTNDITIDNIKIDIVDNYTFLGLYLDTKLSFNIHIDNLNMKLSKIIYLIKRLSYLNITNLILLYNSLFLSNLTYGIEIWGNIYNSNLNILNLSQKKIIRIINKKIIDNSKLPLIRLSHTSILFYNSNILKLDDLITFRNILIIIF